MTEVEPPCSLIQSTLIKLGVVAARFIDYVGMIFLENNVMANSVDITIGGSSPSPSHRHHAAP